MHDVRLLLQDAEHLHPLARPFHAAEADVVHHAVVVNVALDEPLDSRRIADAPRLAATRRPAGMCTVTGSRVPSRYPTGEARRS